MIESKENCGRGRSQRTAGADGRARLRLAALVSTKACAAAALLIGALVAAPLAAQVADKTSEVQVLERDQWPSSRTGEIIRRIEPLRRTVEIYNGQDQARILIQYAKGSIGNAWAFEVKEWLIAFGVDSEHVVLQPGSVNEYSLALSVIK